MKLPKLDVITTTQIPLGKHYQGNIVNNTELQGIVVNNIFDDITKGVGSAVGKIPCVLSKAGPEALQCISCGPDPICLAACAGPTLVKSIMSCL